MRRTPKYKLNYIKKWRKENPERVKQYEKRTKEEIQEYNRNYWKATRERRLEIKAKYTEKKLKRYLVELRYELKHPDRCKIYYEKNKEKILARQKQHRNAKKNRQ